MRCSGSQLGFRLLKEIVGVEWLFAGATGSFLPSLSIHFQLPKYVLLSLNQPLISKNGRSRYVRLTCQSLVHGSQYPVVQGASSTPLPRKPELAVQPQ